MKTTALRLQADHTIKTEPLTPDADALFKGKKSGGYAWLLPSNVVVRSKPTRIATVADLQAMKRPSPSVQYSKQTAIFIGNSAVPLEHPDNPVFTNNIRFQIESFADNRRARATALQRSKSNMELAKAKAMVYLGMAGLVLALVAGLIVLVTVVTK